MSRRKPQLPIIIVSVPGEPEWLTPCLTTLLAHHGGVAADIVVVENDGSGTARRIVADHGFDGVRVLECPNHGFGHANNEGLRACDPGAPYVMFLNPDTEVLEGSVADLLTALDAHPGVGAAGLRQLDPEGTVLPTMRRFPSVLRALGEALGADRLPGPERLAGLVRERVLAASAYDREAPCDWVSGSAFVVRRSALDAAGWFDERFFLYSEETDLCRRITAAGYEVRHLPVMTVRHHVHAGAQAGERMLVQLAWSRRHYGGKHFPPARRAAFLFVTAAGVAVRRRPGRERVLRTLLRGAEPPYEPAPPVAVRERG